MAQMKHVVPVLSALTVLAIPGLGFAETEITSSTGINPLNGRTQAPKKININIDDIEILKAADLNVPLPKKSNNVPAFNRTESRPASAPAPVAPKLVETQPAYTPIAVQEFSDAQLSALSPEQKAQVLQARNQQLQAQREQARLMQEQQARLQQGQEMRNDEQITVQVPADKAKSTDDYELYDGKPIGRIRVKGATSVSQELISSAIKLRKGDTVTIPSVREDLIGIFQLGYFKDVKPTFSFVKDENGVSNGTVEVCYNLVEYPVLTDVEIVGSTLINKVNLAKMLKLERKVPNMVEINKALAGLEEEYKKNGYILARVLGVDVTPEGVLKVTVMEGEIEGYKVTGHRKTKEFVILREMRQKVGEPFNQILAKRSVQRLYNLGLFEEANIKLNPGKDPTKVEVEVEVSEANTATIGVGAGYSDSDGFVGQVTYTDKNLGGRGNALSAKWEFGGKDNANYDLSFTKPWLDKKETSMTINVYRNTYEYADYDRDGHEIARYDKRRTGQEVTFSRADSEYTRNYITLKNRDDKYVEPENGYSNQYYEEGYRGETYGKTAEERRKENFGTTRSISFMRVYDNRDNAFDPHHGKRNAYTFEYAGFGGDFNFRKLSADYRYYWELNPKTKHVLALNLAAGYAWGDMPLSQRFSVGGSNTLRGYKDDQFKGNSMLRASLEYRVPIAKKVQAVAFVDSGYAWDKRDEDAFDLSKMKVGYGVGIRFQSPMGPIRLDYGIGDKRNRFHFAFGGSF